MRTRALSIAFGLTIIAALLAFVPVAPSRFSVSPSYAYAFSCPTPEGGAGTPNADGTFTCTTDVSGSGSLQDEIYNADGKLVNVGNTNVAGGGQLDTSNDPSGPVKCNGFVNFFSNASVCIGRSISAFIGTALITVTAWLLEIAGLIFNWLMYYTVIAFGDATNGFLTTGVLNAINLTWTAFRDISNIIIIGLFTFIAISIILGLNQFGNKKLIARVLIVAILINFSLLFTKIVIDFSNFTSYVFYQSAPNVQVGPPGNGATFTQDGVAGAFIKFLGVTSVSDTFNTLKQGADNADSGWIILLHGLFGATLLLLAAVAFIYGSYLLTVRAVLLVFLLITSSFAFATYLIPKASESKYGWSAWWKALFQNAVFAPLLMALLWATLILAKALAPAGGTLGGLLSDPTNNGNLSALFSYIIVLAFLIASFKVSSSFASSISGFNFAALNIARLATAPLSLGSRFLAAPLLRNTVGRYAYTQREAVIDEAKQARKTASMARASATLQSSYGNTKLAAQARAEAHRLDSLAAEKAIKAHKLEQLADRKFNTVETLAKKLGSPIPTGEAKGYASQVKEKAEVVAKIAEPVETSAADRKDLERFAVENARMARQPDETALRAAGGVAQEVRKGIQESIRSQTATLESQRDTKKHDINRRFDTEVQRVRADATIPADQKGAHEQAVEERRRSELRSEDERIKNAKKDIESARHSVTIAGKTFEKTMAEATADSDSATAQLQKLITETEKNAVAGAVKAADESVLGAVKHIASHESTVLERKLGVDEDVANAARRRSRESKSTEGRLKKMLGELNKKEESTPAASTTPTTP